ncbi:MAG: hypothetical protein ACM3U2_09390 [Deltaproteobacteria bacterium]
MKRFKSITSLTLAGIALLWLASFASAEDPATFRGCLAGDVSHTSIDAQTDYVVVDAAGIATQLGLFEVTVPHLVDLPTRTAAGYYEFTAANGDKLIASFTGLATPTATPGLISIVETATIDPDLSTGRFAGATGSFVVERLFDRIAGTTIGSFDGSISTP